MKTMLGKQVAREESDSSKDLLGSFTDKPSSFSLHHIGRHLTSCLTVVF